MTDFLGENSGEFMDLVCRYSLDKLSVEEVNEALERLAVREISEGVVMSIGGVKTELEPREPGYALEMTAEPSRGRGILKAEMLALDTALEVRIQVVRSAVETLVQLERSISQGVQPNRAGFIEHVEFVE